MDFIEKKRNTQTKITVAICHWHDGIHIDDPHFLQM